MKILVIGPARSSSTALTGYLAKIKGNLTNYNEQISVDIDELYNPWQSSNFNDLLPVLKKSLREKLDHIFNIQDKFIVKFLGLHLTGLSNFIEIIDPTKFDEIHLIERHNFLEQACSRYVAITEGKWINRKLDRDFYIALSKKEKYLNLPYDVIGRTARDNREYLLVKKFLQDQKIAYQQHYYESPIFKFQEIEDMKESNLNYSKLIKNYHYYKDLNYCFSQYFDFKTCKANYKEFIKTFPDYLANQNNSD